MSGGMDDYYDAGIYDSWEDWKNRNPRFTKKPVSLILSDKEVEVIKSALERYYYVCEENPESFYKTKIITGIEKKINKEIDK